MATVNKASLRTEFASRRASTDKMSPESRVVTPC